MKIPEKGRGVKEIMTALEKFRDGDVDWRSGRTWGFVYDAGREAMAVAKEAYMMYLTENALDPTSFPSVMQMENQIISMAANHVGGDGETVGNFTSGGTESIMLALKTARDYARVKHPEIHEPEVILPVTAHAAFHKSCHYLGLKAVATPVLDDAFTADVSAMRAAITPNTILLVGSAPSYAHGVVDPIREIGKLALEKNLLFHVDACMGGFLLPYYKRLGEKITDFDLTVPGVTSLSMDLHKYAYCPKPASIILYKSKELRRYQIYACSCWTGYTIVNPTAGSTKSGGPLAASWAVLNYMGDDGYMELARKKIACMKKLIAGIEAIDELRLQGSPEMSLVCFVSDTVNVFHIVDEMAARGWYIQPQLAFANSKENIHISIAASNVRWVDELLKDLRECVEIAKGMPGGEIGKQITEAFSNIDPDSLTEEMFTQMLGMAGIQGTALPERMAEINEILNALPVKLREKLLVEFLNDLFILKEN